MSLSDLPFEIECVERDGYEIYTVPAPNLVREQTVLLNPHGIKMLTQRFGVRPSRSSLVRWRQDGYPVHPAGPRVLLPTITQLKKVRTSAEALRRFFQVVQELGNEISEAGGVTKWRAARKKGS